jgi:hypothetical protein
VGTVSLIVAFYDIHRRKRKGAIPLFSPEHHTRQSPIVSTKNILTVHQLGMPQQDPIVIRHPTPSRRTLNDANVERHFLNAI